MDQSASEAKGKATKTRNKQTGYDKGIGLQTGGNGLVKKFPFLFGMGMGKSEGSDDEVGLGESMIPIWGSSKLARQNFKKGEIGWGIFNSIMAISDVFLVKSIFTGIAKGGLRALAMGNKPWSARNFWDPTSSYRSFYGNSGFAAKNQNLHHWFIEQRGPIGRFIPNFIKHQMWNLKPVNGLTIGDKFFESKVVHQAIHNSSRQLSLSRLQRLQYGTPNYVLPLILSGSGRYLNN